MRVHWLSLKGALAVALAAAALGMALYLARAAWPWVLLAAAALGGVAYVAVRRLVAGRLETVRSLMQRLREAEFEALAEKTGQSTLGEARHQRARREDELDATLRETRHTAQVLAEKMEALRKMENYRREFIGNVSHELKTPIFSIQGFSETLLEGALEDESVRRSFVEKIGRNADRLRRLARDLAEIARIETGELEMTTAAFDLRPLAEEVMESMEPTAAEKGVTLRAQLPERLPRVEGDRERLRQVLTNLVDNAIKYNQKGGWVEVALRRAARGAAVEVRVVDDGIGVEPEHVERLTERFYRVDQSRSRSQGGTGLGLAIVKHILGAHGSTLSVSSRPGRGSTFGFALPLASASQEAAGQEPSEQEPAEQESSQQKRRAAMRKEGAKKPRR